MNGTDTVATLMEMFSKDMEIEIPSAQTDLIDAGLMDSVALVDLLFQIEAKFNLSLPLEEMDMDNLRSVQNIAAFVDTQMARGNTA